MKKKLELLNYYFRSYLDYSRNGKFNSNQGIFVPIKDIQQGKLSPSSIEELNQKINELQGDVEIHVAPVCLSKKSTDKIIAPFFMIADVDEGRFIPILNRPPYFIRKYLEPSHTSKDEEDFIVGTVEDIDQYLEGKIFRSQIWGQYLEDAENFWKSITRSSFCNYKQDGYQRKDFAWVVPLEKNYSKNDYVVPLYQSIKNSKPPNPLLWNYLTIDVQKQQSLLPRTRNIHLHSGQIKPEFPVNNEQRLVVQHSLGLNNGELLAVNGPPGTGKTALIQNIIASLWVNAALQETQPPVIWATSANNQAILNVMNSLVMKNDSRLDNENLKEQKLLQGRWIEGVINYSLHFPSKSQLQELDKIEHNYQLIGGNYNFMTDLEKRTDLKAHFLTKCSAYANKEFSTLLEAKDYLHKRLQEVYKTTKQGLDFLISYDQYKKELIEEFGGCEKELENQKSVRELSKEEAKNAYSRAIETKLLWDDYCNKEPWFWSLFSFIPVFQERVKRRNENFVLKHQDLELFRDFRPIHRDETSKKIDDYLRDLKKVKDEAEWAFNQADELIQKRFDVFTGLNRWSHLVKMKLKINNEYDPFEDVAYFSDLNLRYEMFLLATHYWEARWLIEIENKKTKSFESLEQKYLKYAMLTPCFVSTFYYLGKRMKKKQDYLFGFIDLLIIDEAGQVPPQLAAPVFSLAKKAIVIGDVLQIQPISNIPKEVDRGNFLEMKTLSKEMSWEELSKNGFTAYAGSAMKIAQSRCVYKDEDDLYGGIMLREHHRCVDSIIEFCNNLAYENKLVPKKGNESPFTLPALGYVDVQGNPISVGGSKCNVLEAEAICKWLATEKGRILKEVNRSKTQKKELKEIVAIITPFKYQKILIDQLLHQYNLDGIKVGTVHTFQGDEKEIILFSSVETSDQKKSFYDQDLYMLNVAASRAKFSFIVFSDWTKFGRGGLNDPSTILRKSIENVSKEALQIYEQNGRELSVLERIKNNRYSLGQKHQSDQVIIQKIYNYYFEHNQGQINVQSGSGKIEAVQHVGGNYEQ